MPVFAQGSAGWPAGHARVGCLSLHVPISFILCLVLHKGVGKGMQGHWLAVLRPTLFASCTCNSHQPAALFVRRMAVDVLQTTPCC